PEDDAALTAWLAVGDQPKAFHESKDAWHALDGAGYRLTGTTFDTAIAAYQCHPDQRSYTLDDLSLRYLRRELGTEAEGGQHLPDLEGGSEPRADAERARAVHDLVG